MNCTQRLKPSAELAAKASIINSLQTSPNYYNLLEPKDRKLHYKTFNLTKSRPQPHKLLFLPTCLNLPKTHKTSTSDFPAFLKAKNYHIFSLSSPSTKAPKLHDRFYYIFLCIQATFSERDKGNKNRVMTLPRRKSLASSNPLRPTFD